MSDTKNATFTFGYSNTDFTRKYKFEGVSTANSAIKAGILALNASLAAGTDGGLKDFFRADDYDASDSENIVGQFTGIVAAQVDAVEETTIF